jgi:addiction module RelE/StbE family toxin
VKILWTRKASRHLRAAYEYWASQSSVKAGDIMLNRIFTAVELLERFPEARRLGRIDGTRELTILPAPFVVVYRVQPNQIEVIALFHGSRKWPATF